MNKLISYLVWLTALPFFSVALFIKTTMVRFFQKRSMTEIEVIEFANWSTPVVIKVAFLFYLILAIVIYAIRY